MQLILILAGALAAITGTIGFYEGPVAIAIIVVIVILFRSFVYNREIISSEIGENEKRTIFVTGAGSGIGQATANLFASKGWIVGYYDIREEKAKETVQSKSSELNTSKCLFGHIDVTDPSSCEIALKEFLHRAEVDHLDCLFNCAGVLAIGEFDEFSLERQIEQVDVNVRGVINLTYKALPYLKKSTLGGRVVSMASIAALGGIPLHAVYSATKAAVYSLTESLNLELYNKYKIYCCDVSVSYVATPMIENQDRKDTIALSYESAYRSPEAIAQLVFYAVHHCRKHREHFYDIPNWFIFKLGFLSRAVGSRLLNHVIETLHGPKSGWNAKIVAKNHFSDKANKLDT